MFIAQSDYDFYFSVLDELRESGKMNMFAAPRMLQEEFDMTKQEAKQIFTAWTETSVSMHTFVPNKTQL